MSPRRRSNDEGAGCLVIVVLAMLFWLYDEGYLLIIAAAVAGIAIAIAFVNMLLRWYGRKRQEAERQRRQEEAQRQAEERQRQLAAQRKRQEAERQRREEEAQRQAELQRKYQEAERQRREEEAQRQAEEQRKRQKAEMQHRQREVWLQGDERNRQRAAQRKHQEAERNRQIEALLQRDTIMDEVRRMSGVEFERFMADFLRKQGYTVKTTKASGDRGVDLLVSTDDRHIAVQLKRYNRPVGNKAVQEALTGRVIYKTNEAWVITTSSFTRNAIEDARATGVRLINDKELATWLSEAKE